jgi:hypothetical protein
MGDLGIPDLDRDAGQTFSNVTDPVVTAHHGEGLGDRFVERFRRHVKLVRDVVQVVDNDGAGFRSHDGNLSYSLFVRQQQLADVRADARDARGGARPKGGFGSLTGIQLECYMCPIRALSAAISVEVDRSWAPVV